MNHSIEMIVDKINMFKTSIKGELTVVISEKNTKDKFLMMINMINKKSKNHI